MKKDCTKLVSHAVKEVLANIFHKAFDIKAEILLQNGPKGECEYVSPSAMKDFNVNRNKKEGTTFRHKTVVDFAKAVQANFYENEYISSIQANEKGFLKIKVNDRFVE